MGVSHLFCPMSFSFAFPGMSLTIVFVFALVNQREGVIAKRTCRCTDGLLALPARRREGTVRGNKSPICLPRHDKSLRSCVFCSCFIGSVLLQHLYTTLQEMRSSNEGPAGSSSKVLNYILYIAGFCLYKALPELHIACEALYGPPDRGAGPGHAACAFSSLRDIVMALSMAPFRGWGKNYWRFSMTMAEAPPPPLQIPATPILALLSLRTVVRVVTMRAPEQPRGWPMATEPP
jgi:hypothetical protein